MVILSIILFPLLSILIGILNASEDIISHEKWDRSAFVFINKWWKELKINKNTKYRKYFFDQLMWKNKYENRNPELKERKFSKYFLFLTDWWHFSKSARIVLEWVQIILAALMMTLATTFNPILGIAFYSALCYILRNYTFSLFYHKVLLNEG